MKWEDFRRWFNSAFWRAFTNRSFPINLPKASERPAVVRSVFDAVKSGRYAPSIPEAEIVSNKGHGVARTTPVFCIEDYIVYYFCIKELEEALAGNRTPNTFGGWHLGGKVRRMEEEDLDLDPGLSHPRYSFDPRAWREAFGEFNSLLFAQLGTGRYSHVLQFDLSNYYDCVRLDVLERWIREATDSSKGWIVSLLFFFLNQWNRKNTGLHPQVVGIPMDALADCSRLLANFYLRRYDRFAEGQCVKSDALYFRYADDQMILLTDPGVVERLMLLLSRRLDTFSLRVNQKKVDVWTVEGLERNRFRHLQSIFKEKGDNKDAALVRSFADQYLQVPLDDLKGSWNEGVPLLNRLLFANLESLPKRIFDRLVARYLTDEYLLRAEADKLARVWELNSQRSRPVDLRRRLIRVGRQTYHNAFHFEVRAFARKRKDKTLERAMEARMRLIELLMGGTRVDHEGVGSV